MKNKLKFISFFVVSLVFIFIGLINVRAAVEVTVSGPDSVAVGKDATVTITVKGYSNNPGTMDIVWNEKLLKCDTSYSQCSKTKPINKDESFSYKFIGVADGDAIVSVTTNYNGADASKKIIVGSGSPTTTTTTTSTTTSSTTTTTVPDANFKSDNANLKTLKITDKNGNELKYTPVFSPTVYTYDMDVASNVDSVNIDVTLEDAKANAIVSTKAKELVAGENNEVGVTVTSESGIKKEYKINIKRAAQDATTSLSKLEIKEAPNFKLEADKYSYSIVIASNVNKLSLDYSTTSESANVEIQGNENLENGSKVKIIVTAEDESKREYTINIVKKENKNSASTNVKTKEEKNPIIIMVLSIIAFALIGLIIHVIRKK